MSDRTDVGGERADIGARNIALDRLQDASRALKLALEMFQKANDAPAVTRMKAMITELDGFDADEGRKDSAGHELGGLVAPGHAERWPHGYDRATAIAALRADGSDVDERATPFFVWGWLNETLKVKPQLRRDGARGQADARLDALEQHDCAKPLVDPQLESRAKLRAAGQSPLRGAALKIEGKPGADAELQARADQALVEARRAVVREYVGDQRVRSAHRAR
jgi:hypothetical protein